MLKIEDYKIIGQKGVLIKLEEYPEDVLNADGLYIPLFRDYETEGGRPASKIRGESYTTVGTILQISDKAQDLIADDKMDIKVGDRVIIPFNQRNEHNHFLVDRHLEAPEFEGYITVHPSIIQAKIN